jgi:hypothetical protein
VSYYQLEWHAESMPWRIGEVTACAADQTAALCLSLPAPGRTYRPNPLSDPAQHLNWILDPVHRLSHDLRISVQDRVDLVLAVRRASCGHGDEECCAAFREAFHSEEWSHLPKEVAREVSP